MTPQQALEELAIGIQQIAVPLKVHEHYARCVNVLHQALVEQSKDREDDNHDAQSI